MIVLRETICPSCSGSGEGMYEGTTCRSCKGRGLHYEPVTCMSCGIELDEDVDLCDECKEEADAV